MKERSHPPALLTQVKKCLREECKLPPAAKIAVAVSGGPDSMALLHCLSLLRGKYGFQLMALTADHGLRVEAAQECQMVVDFCAQQEIDCELVQLELPAGANLQARAREARYARLWQSAQQALGNSCFLATAHHREDRAETLLLRLLRGTSLEGLSVLPARSDRLLRPMIRASKAEVLAHVQRHQLPHVLDPSNQDARFLRVRVRHELLPLLKELGPGIVEHLEALADEADDLPEPLGLNREQRSQLRRALREPAMKIDMPLPAGLRIFRQK